MTDRLSHSSGIAPAPSPIKEVWTIAWPTVLTMTSYTVMQFCDKLMVSQVAPIQLTAQSNGGIWSFNLMALALGTVTVINTFVSQNLGAGKPENGPRYAWAGFWLSILVWAVVLIPYALAIPWLFSSMPEHSEELQRLESGYARILLGGSVLMLMSRSLHQFFFGMHMPKIVTIAAVTGNIVNVVGNYMLIYGSEGVTIGIGADRVHLPGVPGMPRLEVYGAAIATVIGTAVELAIPAMTFLGAKMNARYRTRSAWRFNFVTIKDVIKLGWPAATQWVSEIICWSIFMSMLVGSFGETHMAAGWIALSYMHLSFMPALGFSVAVTSLVGRYIGAGQPDVAEARAHLGLRLAVGYMTACGLLFFLLRYQLVEVFVSADVSPDEAARIVAIGGNLMICAAIFQTFDAFGIVYSGALRGAGDTIWPGLVTIVYSWLFIVLGGWLLVKYAPGLESTGPWIAASVYIILFGLTMWRRFANGRWRAIRLVDQPAPPGVDLIAGLAEPPASLPNAAVRDLAESMAHTTHAAPAARGGGDSAAAVGEINLR
jgi:MATE family multidrug resistance protein